MGAEPQVLSMKLVLEAKILGRGSPLEDANADTSTITTFLLLDTKEYASRMIKIG